MSDNVEGYAISAVGGGDPPYYYKGIRYESKYSLYTGILIDQTSEQLGVKDLVALTAIVLGSPILKKRFVTEGSSKGTSILSETLGNTLGRSSRRIPTPTGFFPPRIAFTKSIGRAVARWVPFVGWGLLAYDAYKIYTKTEEEYERIIRE